MTLQVSTFDPENIPAILGPFGGKLGHYLGTNYPQGIRVL